MGAKRAVMKIVLTLVLLLFFVGTINAQEEWLGEEIISERSKATKIYDLGNGKKKAVIGIAPVHYQDDQGVGQDITNKIENKDDITGYDLGVDELFHLRFRRVTDSTKPLIRAGRGEKYLELQPVNIKSGVEAVVKENKVTYPKVWEQADLSWRIAGHIIRKEITLYDNHPTIFSFKVIGTNLTQVKDYFLQDHVLIDGVDFDFAEAYLENPNDPGSENIPVTTEVRTQGDNQYIDLILPGNPGDYAGWVLDPTLTLQPDETDGLDTYIAAHIPTTNLDYTDDLNIGEQTVLDRTFRALIKFDLSSLPDNAIISSAILSLYVTGDASFNARYFRVYRQKRAWVETQVTWTIYSTGNNWQTAGGFGANDCEQTDIGSRLYSSSGEIGEFADYPLTPTTKAGLDLGNGWLIKTDTELDDGWWHTSSRSTTAANRPKLVVVYTVPTYLAITGSATMTAGSSQTITITAYDEEDNVAPTYTGDKSLTFSAATTSSVSSRLKRTCSDKDGIDVPFGAATTITFTNGVATSTMKLYAVESVSITTTDGSINATGHELSCTVVDAMGMVYDSITGDFIAGAQVTLHTPDGSIYSGTPQDNPQITDALGRYNFYAEKGKYYITATAQGYRDHTSSIFTQDGGDVLVNCNMYPLDYVDQNGLLISQSANKTTAKRGDIITYFFKVKNTNSSSLSSPEISVKLPHNFKYIKDSALRDGVKSDDPSETSGRLIFKPDNIGVNTAITYSYRVRIGIDAYEGKNINEGIVSHISDSQTISTGPVYAVVYIKSLFSPKGLVIGKVFEDTNNNGIQDIGESPLPYVAILSEDGRVILTDENGQYTIVNFNYDVHVLKIDQRVLPGGAFAISGLNPPKDFPKDIPRISKTIDIPKSGIVKANFPITPEERAKYREVNKLSIASWEERLSGVTQEDKELKESKAQKEILTGYYEQAMAYYKKGKYSEAISEWKKINKIYKERRDSIQPILSKKSKETPKNGFILVGLADGEIGKFSRFGNVASTEASDKEKLHKELYKNGRVAFYLKGIIQGKYLLTARLDTSKDLEDELYEAIDPDRYYPIYGDTSTQIDETDSQEPIYVALTWNKNLIKYGNYSTEEFSEVEYAKYSRTLPGLKIHLEGDRAEITSFTSQSRQVPRKDYINPRGLSGPYYLSRNPVIEQSERVYLEIHDKDKDDVVLSTVSYERDKDYDMFYDDGYIYFSEPIRSEDRYGNPQYIIVQYEYSPPLDLQYITQGVRIKIEPIPETFTLGFSNVVQNADDLHLTGADTELKLFNDTTTISGEYSYSDNNFTNYATKAEINSTIIPKVNVSAHYLNVNDGFSNPTGTLDQGVEEYRAKASYNIFKPTDIIVDSYSRRSILSHMRTIHYGGEVLNRWDRLTLSGKATYERQKDEDTMNSLSDMKWTTLGGDLSYRLTKKITLHSGYEWKDEIDSFPLGDSACQYNTFTGRIDYQLDKDNLLYLRNDHIEAAGYMKNISAVGVEQILDEKTSSYAEYKKEGSTLRQNMGYKSKVKLTKWLSSNVSFERSRVSGATSLDSDASSVSLEAKPKDELWIASKVELRHYQETKEYNLNYESKGELTPDLTAFSKGSFSRSKDADTCTTTRRDKKGVIGLSYRPVANDRLNVIGKYGYKRKEDIQIASQESQTTNHIGSVEAAYDLTKNMTLGCRYAMNKSVEKGQDSIDRSHINLFVTRLNYRLTPRIDLLTEGRYIYLHETGDWKLGSSIEIGYKPIKDLRLGIGYTFTEYDDHDAAHNDQDYLSRGPYFKITLSPSF